MKKENLDKIIPKIISKLKGQIPTEEITFDSDINKRGNIKRFYLSLSELNNAVSNTSQEKNDDFYQYIGTIITHYHNCNLPQETNPCPQSQQISDSDIVMRASILGRNLSNLN